MKLATLLLILVGLVVISGCVEIQQQAAPEVPEPPVNINQQSKVIVKEMEVPEPPELLTCNEWAESILPEKVWVYSGANRCEGALKSEFDDGEPVRIIGDSVQYIKDFNRVFKMVSGSVVGEDGNLFYLKSYKNEYLNLGYSKEVFEEGILLGKDKFEFSVTAYELLEDERVEADEVDCYWQAYKIINPVIISCDEV